MDAFWLARPSIRAAANRAVSGEAGVWPLEWFASAYAAHLPFRRAAVIGCGLGELERDLLRKNVAATISAIDVAPNAVAFARREAEREGLASRIDYQVADAATFLRGSRGVFDAVFFHGSLHHLRVGAALDAARDALAESGFIYVDEYVGPSMHEYGPLRLLPANLAYYLLVARPLRRTRLIRRPLNPNDPTEMLESSRIVPALRARFEVLEERAYGGNLLALIYPNLHRTAALDEQLETTVTRLLRAERLLMRIERPHHCVIVARKR